MKNVIHFVSIIPLTTLNNVTYLLSLIPVITLNNVLVLYFVNLIPATTLNGKARLDNCVSEIKELDKPCILM